MELNIFLSKDNASTMVSSSQMAPKERLVIIAQTTDLHQNSTKNICKTKDSLTSNLKNEKNPSKTHYFTLQEQRFWEVSKTNQ